LLERELGERGCLIRQPPGEQLVGHHAQRVQIGACSCLFSPGLLGREVGGGAEDEVVRGRPAGVQGAVRGPVPRGGDQPEVPQKGLAANEEHEDRQHEAEREEVRQLEAEPFLTSIEIAEDGGAVVSGDRVVLAGRGYATIGVSATRPGGIPTPGPGVPASGSSR